MVVAVVIVLPFLLLADLLHGRQVWQPLAEDRRFNVNLDGSYIEVLGYGLLLAAAIVLAAVASRRPSARVLVAWASVLTLVALDDALQLHERGGEMLVASLGLRAAAGLRAVDFGELVVWAALGACSLLVLCVGHRCSGPSARRQSWWLAGALAVLVFFAVVVDMGHIALQSVVTGRGERLISWIEAAGELLGTALLLSVAIHIWRQPAHDRRHTAP